MTDVKKVVDDYIATWNETDPERRRELVAQAFADDAIYIDAHRYGQGTDGIADMIGTAQEQFPGHRIELSYGPDAHNDRVRFSWTLHGPDGGDAVAGGADFATLAGDGRLQRGHGLPRAGRLTGPLTPAGSRSCRSGRGPWG